MARNTLNDGTSGDVVIRSGPPASGGGGGSGGGGSFGGNRVGASGAFRGPSKKTMEARRRAKQAHLQAQEQQRIQAAAAAAQAEELARAQTRQQALAAMQARHVAVRTQIDQRYVARVEQLTASLEREISAMRGPGVGVPLTDRFHLHVIEKQQRLIEGLVARKTAALHEKTGLRGHTMGTIRSRVRPVII